MNRKWRIPQWPHQTKAPSKHSGFVCFFFLYLCLDGIPYLFQWIIYEFKHRLEWRCNCLLDGIRITHCENRTCVSLFIVFCSHLRASAKQSGFCAPFQLSENSYHPFKLGHMNCTLVSMKLENDMSNALWQMIWFYGPYLYVPACMWVYVHNLKFYSQSRAFPISSSSQYIRHL